MLQHKPYKLALVIGSGGIRSIVGIGVFKALSEAGLEPDLIVGCSAGAIFGAALAEGNGAVEALRKSERLWTAELTNATRWSAIPSLLLAKFGFFKEDFSFKDDRKIAHRIGQAFGDTQIQNLPIAMRVTATNAHTGQRVVMDKGQLVDALRASIAIPFVFPPHLVDGQYMVDGVVSDPLPVLAAQDAQTVVAVGLDSLMPRRANSPFKLFNRTFAATTNNLMHAQLELARANGMQVINIQPNITRHVRLFETAAMAYLVDEARCATELAIDEIRQHMQAARTQLLHQQAEQLAIVQRRSADLQLVRAHGY